MSSLHDFSLLDILPDSLSQDAEVQAVARAVQGELHAVARAVDAVRIWSRLDELSGAVLDLLAWQLHVDFWRPELSDQVKRRLIGNSIAWHRVKGTPYAIKQLFADLGVEAQVLEWFQPEGQGLAPYEFAVRGIIKQPLYRHESWGPQTIESLEEAVAVAKNTRSWLGWLSLALELEAPATAVASGQGRVRDTAGCRLLFYPHFDITPLDVRTLDPDELQQQWLVRDTSLAGLVLGRSWGLDTMLAEGVPGLGLDWLLPGLEGEWEPAAGQLAVVGQVCELPVLAELVAAPVRRVFFGWESELEATGSAADATGTWFGADYTGLDNFAAMDSVPLDSVPLDAMLETMEGYYV